MEKSHPKVGLPTQMVAIVPYQAAWVEIYRQEEKVLQKLLHGQIQAIAHIGSTAIVGLAAKPIIDIAVAIDHCDRLGSIKPILKEHQYEDQGDRAGGYLFFKRKEKLVTHHLHFVEYQGKRWHNYLLFKERLNTDTRIRDEYVALKQQLGEQFADNRPAYTQAKNDFISQVLKQGKSLANFNPGK